MIDKGIIFAFVERWHRDTNSFHLPIGEMMITLDNVSSLLHISITGAFFSVSVFNKDECVDILAELLGVSHGVAYAEFNVTRTTTVRYSWLLDVYHQRCREQHWQMAARAFMLFLVGCTLFSDKTALAYLYDNLQKASIHQTRTVSGLSPSYVEDYPRALKWKPKRDKVLVLPFRKALDEIDVDDVCWTPYGEHQLKRPFEDVSLFRGWIR
uniref:Protein MAIN-LIKE 1-like n=1 Tax=Cicer arietinum TaxID=3827 RepID=A0A1S3E5Z3_CICAR|nr:protein MAIN-LIKE 1-like [Cicer arietinum]